MNKPVLGWVLATFACGSAAACFHSQLEAERERTQHLQSRLADLEGAAPTSPFQVSRQPSPPVAAPVTGHLSSVTPARTLPATSAMPAAAAIVRPAPAEAAARMNQYMERQRAMLKDPEYRQAMRSQQRYGLQQTYPDLARELGISTDQANQLLDLLADQQTRSMDTSGMTALHGMPDQATVMAMQRKAEERERANRAEIAALLGQDGLQQWQEYQQSLPMLMRARQLSSAFDGAGLPLRDDQRQPFRDALVRSEKDRNAAFQAAALQHPDATRDPLAWHENVLDATARSHERVRDSVASILTAEQMQVLSDMQEQELAMQRAGMRMQRAQMEHQGTAEVNSLQVQGGFVSSYVMPSQMEASSEEN